MIEKTPSGVFFLFDYNSCQECSRIDHKGSQGDLIGMIVYGYGQSVSLIMVDSGVTILMVSSNNIVASSLVLKNIILNQVQQ